MTLNVNLNNLGFEFLGVTGTPQGCQGSERQGTSEDDGMYLGAKTYYVYIMTNKSRTLYTGVTNNLEKRVGQHKLKLLTGFTSQYNLNRLVYFEAFGEIRSAIQREKQIKGWLRAKKVALIIAGNPAWRDLSHDWYGKGTPLSS